MTLYWYMLNPACSNSSSVRALIAVPTRASRNSVLACSSFGSAARTRAGSGMSTLTGISVSPSIVARHHDGLVKRLEGQMSSIERRTRWFALAVIVTAQFMVVLDVAIVNVALPSIKTDLHFSQESLQWVVTAYSILFGGVLL